MRQPFGLARFGWNVLMIDFPIYYDEMDFNKPFLQLKQSKTQKTMQNPLVVFATQHTTQHMGLGFE